LKTDSTYRIQNYVQQLCSWSKQDVLVNLTLHKGLTLDFGFESELLLEFDLPIKSLIQRTQKFEREFGISPLCLAEGKAKLKVENGYDTCFVPLVLYPLQIRINRSKSQVTLIKKESECFINPYIFQYLANQYNFYSQVEPEMDMEGYLEEAVKQELISEVSTSFVLDLFHHHRYQVLRELEELCLSNSYSNALQEILGDGCTESMNMHWEQSDLLPMNLEQETVINLLQSENVVLQGPPGTGKSQVLCNLIGKALAKDQNCLVISEKKAALDVIVKKMHLKKLDTYLFVVDSQTSSKEFIGQIRKTWEAQEEYVKEHSLQQSFYLERKNQLQFLLNRINQAELIGGVSLEHFMNLAASMDFQNQQARMIFPSLKEFCADQQAIAEIYCQGLAPLLQKIQVSVFKGNELNDFLRWVQLSLDKLKKLPKNFEQISWSDLQNQTRDLIRIQLIENCKQHAFWKLLEPQSKPNQKFQKLVLKREKLKQNIEVFASSQAAFKELPSPEEIEGLLEELKQKNWRKVFQLKRRLRQLFKSTFVPYEDALEKLKQLNQARFELEEVELEFKKFGCNHLEQDLVLIANYQLQLKEEDWLIHARYHAMGQIGLAQFLADLKDLSSVCNTYMKLASEDIIEVVFQNIQNQQELLQKNLHSIASLHPNSYSFFKEALDFSSYKAIVLKSNFGSFETHFPELAKFTSDLIHLKLKELFHEKELETKLLVTRIQERIATKFQYFHSLLRNSPAKLSKEEKEFRLKLKRGKAILVKEFAKSKAHLTIRELLSSDAGAWIRLLKPISLSNPVELVKLFPLERDLFDLVLIDEASQMPLHNALGALQRAKRVLIAGDEQQMAPSNYFKKEAEDSVTVMHQATFHLKGMALKIHYRSLNPELIQFSNRYFYDNSLFVIPARVQKNTGNFLHYCTDGIYENRQNELEANQVVKILIQAIQSKKSMGVVAFSETQLACILDKIPSEFQALVEKKQEENQLFFKTIENVQGDECDHLIISFAYGFNEDRTFHLRFGPLNKEFGAKRLNVLFSRAKERIDFVTSIQAKDFKLSTNESVNLLKHYFLQLENQEQNKRIFEVREGVSFLPDEGKAVIAFNHPNFELVNVLASTYDLLQQRGWKIEFSPLISF
jgi:hypothetical protein